MAQTTLHALSGRCGWSFDTDVYNEDFDLKPTSVVSRKERMLYLTGGNRGNGVFGLCSLCFLLFKITSVVFETTHESAILWPET